MPIKSLMLATLLPLSLALSACNSGGVSSDVSARQDTMKNWKDTKDSMESMIKSPQSFDAAKFKEDTQFLADDALTPWQHFQDKAAVGGANTTVWSNPEGFTAAAEKFKQAATNLNTVAQSANTADQVQPAFNELGESCKSCHQEFKAK
uniref:Cytochrome c, class II n=1 Tax=Psychrobacter sp. (strain PRwf-1) TaxID=349106 RepID=A5WCH2_PSYWF